MKLVQSARGLGVHGITRIDTLQLASIGRSNESDQWTMGRGEEHSNLVEVLSNKAARAK
ncbi:MAG: hypothetical protein JWL62_725 [Hyphomicrobiales bacterium]|nr:hypothetical protein [Hyphomicrobiales bacterium]